VIFVLSFPAVTPAAIQIKAFQAYLILLGPFSEHHYNYINQFRNDERYYIYLEKDYRLNDLFFQNSLFLNP
jgi:hypothetical protein